MKREQKVEKWVRLWQKRWLLDHWGIEVIFKNDEKKPDNPECYAGCSANIQYNEAEITIYQPFWTVCESDKKRKETICHEIGHILTWELAALASHLLGGNVVTRPQLTLVDERTTEHIAKALVRAYE